VKVLTGDDLDLHLVHPITQLLEPLGETRPAEHRVVDTLASQVRLAAQLVPLLVEQTDSLVQNIQVLRLDGL